MEYIKVDNKQIAEVGFGEGFYGPETLGIIFTPNRKQAAGRVPGNEYHYDGVTARVHRAMTAADDVYVYFSENIKKHPEAFPYVKIEAVPKAPVYASQEPGMFDDPRSEGWVADPTEPRRTTQATVTGTTQDSSGTTKTMPTQLPASETSDTPSTALAVIDTMADDLLFTPGAVTDAQLAAGREWYLTEAKKYDISTEKARTELKRFARRLQKLRTGIEARAKELTGATKRKIAAIDAEKRRLVMLVGGIEDEVLRPLTEWEKEEERRKIELMNTVTMLADLGTWSYDNISAIEEQISYLESFCVSNMQEYKISAESAITASLKVLKTELERRKVSEANEAELAKLRAESAERAEKDRLDAVAKAAVEAARITIREEVIAELRPQVHVSEVTSYSEPTAVLPSKGLDIYHSFVPTNDHESKVHAEARDAILLYSSIDPSEADTIIAAIAKGLIPHMSITY
jgi:hypothetical protein